MLSRRTAIIVAVAVLALFGTVAVLTVSHLAASPRSPEPDAPSATGSNS
jgi:hypothetical protein